MELQWVQGESFRTGEREAAERRLAALARDHTDLLAVRVTARPAGHHRHGGQEVRITGRLRRRELVATRTRPDLGLALNEALSAFEREVWRLRHQRTQRRSARPAAPPLLGIIDAVARGEDHGFVLCDSGERVFFHRNALKELDFDALVEGQRVGLNIEAGEKGPQATVVLPAPPGVPAP